MSVGKTAELAVDKKYGTACERVYVYDKLENRGTK